EQLLAAADALEQRAVGELTAGEPRATGTARPAAAPRRFRMGVVEQAIVAALEHGSHTLAELGVVTAISASELRAGLRRLLAAGKIGRAGREGKTAYVLSASE
ncbi:MAG TPA: hypothetical protein VED41_09395, partial [Solirubrobacteraceae bacterium]|nr:hypothetical protein [Solirubrobacteraceae bacterium]